jgi:hypothetical protein
MPDRETSPTGVRDSRKRRDNGKMAIVGRALNPLGVISIMTKALGIGPAPPGHLRRKALPKASSDAGYP